MMGLDMTSGLWTTLKSYRKFTVGHMCVCVCVCVCVCMCVCMHAYIHACVGVCRF